ncbi:AraC family transcriptional regulator [Clostridium sp.]|uniref:AraC family transcriptional regulator n=1 Tax=Clostridium sp. TaxID=1506 RepID=UPI00262C662C|nr:AraC family transcriptional regulator [Clostridium sp.]
MKNVIKFYEKGSVEIVSGQSSHCFPLHSHESFCIGAIIKGTALITINNNKCLLKEPMAFIIPSNTGISITTDSQYDYITICFKNELKKRVANIKFNKYFIKMKFTEEILALCDIFKKDNNEDQFLSSILKLTNNAIDHNSLLRRSKSNEIVSLICKYIKENATEKFDLDKLAKLFHLSKYHLIRILKKEIGVTPNQYYIQAKMRIIKSQIYNMQSETSLAVNLNLYDQSHLCKLFIKQMGVSIHDYKKNIIKK